MSGPGRPATMSRPARSRVLPIILILLTGALLTACSSLPGVPAASGPLVTVTTEGGHCINGPCGSTIVIERDGRVHQAAPAEADLGDLPGELLTALDAAIKTTDFDVVRARPFAGECPVAFDGQEWIYEFGGPGGVERVASCETEIDPAHPAFAATTAALQAVDVIPSP
jgi:hypothetical protein